MKKSLFLSLAVCVNLFGQSIAFEDILNQTLQNNQELKAKKTQIQKSKVELDEAIGAGYGVLKFAENITRTNHAGYVFGMKMGQRSATFGDFGFDGPAMGLMQSDLNQFVQTAPNALNNPEAVTNYESKLTYEMPIFTGFKLTNAKNMMQLQVLANEAKVNFDEKTLSLEVLKAYNGAVAAKEFIKAANEAKLATKSYLTFANEMYNEGFITQIDVKQAEAYDLDVDAKISEATKEFELALAYLKFLSQNNQISDVQNFVNLTVQNSSLEALKSLAIQNREDLSWMKLNQKTAQTAIDYAKGDNYPMIGMHLEYGFNDKNLANFESEKDYYLLAGGLEYKIFDGFETKNKIEKARLDWQKATHYTNYMTEGIALEVENNFLTLNTKTKIVKQKQKALELSKIVEEKTAELYKNKLTTMTNLLLQQANKQKAQAELIMAHYDESIAKAKLKISIGEKITNEGTK